MSRLIFILAANQIVAANQMSNAIQDLQGDMKIHIDATFLHTKLSFNLKVRWYWN